MSSEPLTAEEEAAYRAALAGPYRDDRWSGDHVARLLATLDAARAATPDNAGESPIDVDVLATALCDDDDHLYYEDERHDRSSCGHRAQAARLVARLSESTGSEEGGPTRVE